MVKLPTRVCAKLNLPRLSFQDAVNVKEPEDQGSLPPNWNELAMAAIFAAMAYQLYENGSLPDTPPNFNPIYVPEDGMATLFGFTATFCDKNNMPLFNVLALRGTVTDEEAFYDAKDWSDTTSCLLPTVGERSYSIPSGLANASLYAFYADGDLAFSGLGPSCQVAVAATQAQANLPWLCCGHSLGGGMVTLAVLDGLTAGSFGSKQVQCITFASTYVGDSALASAFNTKCPKSTRVANLADWVPSFLGPEPSSPELFPPAIPYVHVGELQSFIWQTGSDWANHQLDGTYFSTIFETPCALTEGVRMYPF